jgi:hypothetical protein
MRPGLVFAIFAAVAAASFVNVPTSRAQDGNAPWCAMVNTGFDNVDEKCVFQTFEACRPFVLAGNRGFCEENPRYTGAPVKYHRKRHIKAY